MQTSFPFLLLSWFNWWVAGCPGNTHTHPFNGPFSRTTQVSQYQKCKTNVDFTEARDSEWQWHQLGHMQVCSSLQTDNHTSYPPLCFLQAGALPAARPTASKHWRHAGCPGKGVVKRVSCSYCNPCCSCRTWMTTLVLLWRRWCMTSDSVKWDFPHLTTNARMKCSKSTHNTVSSL